MKNKIILFFLLFLFIKVNAQNSISGTITDNNTGNTLPGVNIIISDLNSGTVSNVNGYYILNNLPNGQFFVTYSFIGYESVTKKIVLKGDTHLTINIAMKPMIVQSQEVVVTGSFTGTQHENTVQISTLNSKSINQTGAMSVMASLKKIPGVSVVSKGPGVMTPVIQGLSLSNILVLNKGIPMENFQFSMDHPYLVNESGISRIEVIKGPASLMYGSGAVGGVINFIGEPAARPGKIQGNINLKLYSNTLGTNSDFGIKGNHNGFIWGIGAGINSQEDYIQGNGKFAPNTRFNENSARVNIGLLKKVGSFRLYYNYNRAKLGMAVPPALSIVTVRGRKNSVWFQNLTDNLLISKNKLFLGNFKINADFSYQNNNRRLEGSSKTPVMELVNMTLQTFTYRVKGTYECSSQLKSFLGLQGMAQSNKNFEAPQHVIPNANQNDISIFSMTRYQWKKILILEGGLRFDHRKVVIPSFISKGTGLTTQKIVRNFNNLSASAGANLHLSEKLLFRLNIASAFRSPNIAELTQNGVHGNRYEIGNSDLKNQQNTEADMGFHFHSLHSTIDLSAFYNNINNFIYLAPTGTTSSGGFPVYKYLQTPSVLYGGQAGIHIHPHPLNWLHLILNYTYTLGKKQNGEYLPLIPANKIHSEIMLKKDVWNKFLNSYFRISVDHTFAQNHPSQFEESVPGYTLTGISAGTSVKINKNIISINLIGNNIFNTVYMDYLSTLKEVGIYNMGRNITLSISYSF